MDDGCCVIMGGCCVMLGADVLLRTGASVMGDATSDMRWICAVVSELAEGSQRKDCSISLESLISPS